MSKWRRVIACSFDSAGHLRGQQRTYEAVKASVLAAGRFSTFEASNSARDAALFMQLERDPDVEIFQLGYPWHGVRLRQPPADEAPR